MNRMGQLEKELRLATEAAKINDQAALARHVLNIQELLDESKPKKESLQLRVERLQRSRTYWTDAIDWYNSVKETYANPIAVTRADGFAAFQSLEQAESLVTEIDKEIALAKASLLEGK